VREVLCVHGEYALGTGDQFMSVFTGPLQDGLLAFAFGILGCFTDVTAALRRAVKIPGE